MAAVFASRDGGQRAARHDGSGVAHTGGRRTGEEVTTAIVRAALFELAEYGSGDFSIERVAKRANASRMSVYRRWPGQAELIAESIRRAEGGQTLVRPEYEEEKRRRPGPRRRGTALTAPIFEAALVELAEAGYGKFSMERVASRAQASKGSLYRRWSNRAELVIDAIAQSRRLVVEAPATGSVRSDLLAFLCALADVYNGTDGEAAHGLMVESVHDPELRAAVRSRLVQPTNAAVLEILTRGAAFGEVRPDALVERIASIGPQLLRQHYMIYGGPISGDIVRELVDVVLVPLISIRA